jgi:Cdc6-like AAA superfamily ATPase
MTDSEARSRIALQAAKVFTPAAPVDKHALFAGRKEQLRKVVDTVVQRGQHAIIFGERGVGKTSLANVLEDTLRAPGGEVITAHVNCDSGDTYESLWTKIFGEVELHTEVRSAGFQSSIFHEVTTVADELRLPVTTNKVRKYLTALSESALLVVIVDEFDRVQNGQARAMFADTIKMLSDHAVPATLVIVGVADTVDELLAEHQSIERALVQVHMPRMSAEELSEIITKGISKLNLKIDSGARDRITLLSRGLPHYTHALSLHAVRAALDDGQLTIEMRHVDTAIQKALNEAQQSTISAYHKAVSSQRKDNLYSQVLLACALAETDPMGYFAPADLREPMSRIMSKPYEIANYIQHLNAFCKEERGNVLQRTGVPRRYRYRFRNPLMQPFVTLQGFASGLLDRSLLREGF